MEAKSKFVPFTGLVITKPVQTVDMEGLVKAAQLYLEGKKGEDAFACVHRNPMKYKYVPSPLEYSGFRELFRSREIHRTAALLFGEPVFEQSSERFFPYVLTKLCGDLLGEETTSRARYHPKDCNYTDDENGLCISLSKSIDYCSYHNLSVLFSDQDWKITIEGCWRCSDRGQGPMGYHPPENRYCGNVVGSGGTVTSIMHNGERLEEGFALWGIDASRLVVHQDTATA